MAEEARRGGNVLRKKLILEQLGARRDHDRARAHAGVPRLLRLAHRERDRRGEIGERLPDARPALDQHATAVLEHAREAQRQLHLRLAHAIAGEVALAARGVAQRGGDRRLVELDERLAARADRDEARALRARCARRSRRPSSASQGESGA